MKMLYPLNQHRRGNRSTQPPRRGFTLVEMLVVIAIIGMLAGLVTAGAMAALRRAKITKISMEVNSLEMACQEYKTKYGEYPPDFAAILTVADQQVVLRHLAKAFPRYQPGISTGTPTFDWAGFQADLLAGWGTSFAALSPASSLTFWLGGRPTWRLRTVADPQGAIGDPILPGQTAFSSVAMNPVTGFTGFSANQQNPFEASNSRTNPIFDFAPDQISYYAGQLMCYPRGVTTRNANNPLVYFRAENGNYTLDGTPGGTMKSYSPTGFTGLVRPAADWRLATLAPYVWINPQSVQIFSAGLDNLYTTPTGAGPLQFPSGGNYGVSTFDDITNFSGGTLEDSRK